MNHFISKVLEQFKLSFSIPKPENCLIKQVTKQGAEHYITEFYEQFKESDCYSLLLKEHKTWEQAYWIPFISKIKNDDELWLFSTPQVYWDNMMGRDGFVIFRGHPPKKVAQLIFKRS